MANTLIEVERPCFIGYLQSAYLDDQSVLDLIDLIESYGSEKRVSLCAILFEVVARRKMLLAVFRSILEGAKGTSLGEDPVFLLVLAGDMSVGDLPKARFQFLVRFPEFIKSEDFPYREEFRLIVQRSAAALS